MIIREHLIRNQVQNDYSPIISTLPNHHLRSKEGRQWKKCPKEEKQKFQNTVINFLTSSFVGGDRKEYFVGKNEHLTLEEKVAKWQFMNMDRNNDGVSTLISLIIYSSATMPYAI
jgi:hypothetical protein